LDEGREEDSFDCMTIDEVHTLLGSRLVEGSAMPKDYSALTRPIRISTEQSIVESILGSLRQTEYLATLDGRRLTFWRVLKG
jgi:hypothetical protein